VIIAATGHRPDKLGGYSDRVYWHLVAVAEQYLHSQQPDEVISGMALGWDQAFAEAALQLGIPVCAAVPFDGQASRWPRRSRRHYEDLLSLAKWIHVVSPGPYELWKMQARNRWMVDNCNRLAALWNGTPGGTANCLQYARRKVPIDNLWGRWLRRSFYR
jgi:uncharacterized phage-like protein YoqJ